MPTHPAEWSDLRVLLALARAGSMVAAAKTLGVEHTTVGRRLDALEKALGARLVTRSRTGVTLTDAGREALRAAEAMERAHDGLVRTLQRTSGQPDGRVRVSMTDGFLPVVAQLLPALSARHPTLEVELVGSTSVVQLEKGEADLALRFLKPTEPFLVARKVLDVGWSLFATADYVARRGRPASADALGGHDVIGFDASLSGAPGARWLASVVEAPRIVARANTTAALASMVASGLGLGVLPCFTAEGLVRLVPDVVAVTELYAVVHEDLRDAPRVRVVLDHLVDAILAQRARLSGRPDA